MQDTTPQTPPGISPPSDAVVLNSAMIQQLQRITRNTPDFVSDLVSVFLDEAPDQVRVMARAADEPDCEQLEVTAHALKSSSAILGGTQFSELCRVIEELAAAGRPQEARPMVPELGTALTELQTALRELRA